MATEKKATKRRTRKKAVAGEAEEQATAETKGKTKAKSTKAKSKSTKAKSKSSNGAGNGATDFMMWVGRTSYPDIPSFVNEAKELGVSKRVSKFPTNLELGKTKVYLVHDEGVSGVASIFGYFTVEAAEVIVEKKTGGKKKEGDITTEVSLREVKQEPDRLCGRRDNPGAKYLTGTLHLFDDYLDYNQVVDEEGKRFRNIKAADPDTIEAGPTAPSPLERAPRTINLTEDQIPPKGSKWQPEEQEALLDLIEKFGVFRGIREFERQTNRSNHSIQYQWYRYLKTLDK